MGDGITVAVERYFFCCPRFVLRPQGAVAQTVVLRSPNRGLLSCKRPSFHIRETSALHLRCNRFTLMACVPRIYESHPVCFSQPLCLALFALPHGHLGAIAACPTVHAVLPAIKRCVLGPHPAAGGLCRYWFAVALRFVLCCFFHCPIAAFWWCDALVCK